MRFRYLLICSIFVLFHSCQEADQIDVDTNNLLLSNWSNPIYEGETTTFSRSNSLPKDSYGVSFQANGIFIERSSGWCGTPPLVFSDYTGSFKKEGTLIEISTEFFPGNFNWRIIELTKEKLVVKRELSDQEKEHRALMNLFKEIENMAYSVSCSDAKDWQFVAYGSKACGGPQGYIPYNSQINTVDFLEKIAAYHQAEKDYNINWNIISTCDIPSPPTGVICENGFPYLVY